MRTTKSTEQRQLIIKYIPIILGYGYILQFTPRLLCMILLNKHIHIISK